ncbi:hypothetical protein HZB69_00745 [Candidatus Amesbacteria bacterium]|nr:hypothetical protein [Candidatus Amesbacteria bacterium]
MRKIIFILFGLGLFVFGFDNASAAAINCIPTGTKSCPSTHQNYCTASNGIKYCCDVKDCNGLEDKLNAVTPTPSPHIRVENRAACSVGVTYYLTKPEADNACFITEEDLCKNLPDRTTTFDPYIQCQRDSKRQCRNSTSKFESGYPIKSQKEACDDQDVLVNDLKDPTFDSCYKTFETKNTPPTTIRKVMASCMNCLKVGKVYNFSSGWRCEDLDSNQHDLMRKITEALTKSSAGGMSNIKQSEAPAKIDTCEYLSKDSALESQYKACQACMGMAGGVRSNGKPPGVWSSIGCIEASDPIELLKQILLWATILGGGFATAIIGFQGLQIVLNGDDPKKIKTSQEVITAAIAGLLLIVFSIFLMNLIGLKILDLSNLGFWSK